MSRKTEALNNPWLVALAGCGFILSGVWWLLDNKEKLPDELEPVTVAEMAPTKASLSSLEMDNVVRNIPWALKETKRIQDGKPSEHQLTGLHVYLCGGLATGGTVEGEFRRYERLSGAKHFSEGARCE